jgi:hypothetical protein
MKERPILFNGAMVRAILDGSKTQTRRIMKPQPLLHTTHWYSSTSDQSLWMGIGPSEATGGTRQTWGWSRCPFGQVGDQLWVRETFQPVFAAGREYGENTPDWGTGEGYDVKYPATDEIIEWIDGDDNITSRCKPSIHMPRWASRIQLEITGVRVERLQDISEEDAWAEGVMQIDNLDFERPEKYNHALCPQCGGTGLYMSISGSGGVSFDNDCTKCDTHEKLFKHLWNSTGGNWEDNPYVWCISFRRLMS